MSIPTKAGKKPPGRPRKAEADRLEQFSVRLPPKLKFGLEMLARAQHRSLSQAVEWAVQVGLNSFEADREGLTLGQVLDDAWEQHGEPARILTIYRHAPMLLSFEDGATCELIEKSHDLQALWREIESVSTSEERLELEKRLDVAFYEPVLARWQELQDWAITEANAGRTLQGHSIATRLGLLEKALKDRPRSKAKVGPMWQLYEEQAAQRQQQSEI